MIAYESNGTVLIIRQALRHKSLQSSRKYIHNVQFKEEDFETIIATTSEEIQKLSQSRWTKYDEATLNGIQMHFPHKPKRFAGFKK